VIDPDDEYGRDSNLSPMTFIYGENISTRTSRTGRRCGEALRGGVAGGRCGEALRGGGPDAIRLTRLVSKISTLDALLGE
jgi:hypothetical protein